MLYLALNDWEVWREADIEPMLERYRQAVNIFAPDAICVPFLHIADHLDARGVYWRFREISEVYTARMEWPPPSRGVISQSNRVQNFNRRNKHDD